MDNPFESRLRSLMHEADEQRPDGADAQRLDRVLHKAHIRSGALDVVTLFTHWAYVLSECSPKGKRGPSADTSVAPKTSE
ncbi:MAG TPA: hypothetical protein ENI17_08875 [Pseudomonas xinjiangensis]|uniref:CrfX protein n=2 Tax=root TaxID=1 RepID=A0A7V1BLI1_9GAMM|nr:hypothetical protein [Halopseudomonas xinjiangensis]HEC47727.1 hypothetical protein [Halopseudomonas xinjiangensis]